MNDLACSHQEETKDCAQYMKNRFSTLIRMIYITDLSEKLIDPLWGFERNRSGLYPMITHVRLDPTGRHLMDMLGSITYMGASHERSKSVNKGENP